MAGILYLVATPIGNDDDITLRAVNTLRTADLVVCEERREGERVLRRLEIQKPIETLNEHNEAAATTLIVRTLQQGKSIALISDCGTPVFSDPGQLLVQRAVAAGIRVVPVPGASSLMPALTVSGFPIDRFLYYGWLSPKKERRRAELRLLIREPHTVVLLETPYRLVPLLRDLTEVFGDRRRICLALNLTMPDEQIFHGTPKSLFERFSGKEMKGEFVLLIEGSRSGR
jgi:16S rRNA (cytidine1402-2'-O)-methyltransferase